MTSFPSQAGRAPHLFFALLALQCSSSSTNEAVGGGGGAAGAGGADAGAAVVRCGSLACDATQLKKCCFTSNDSQVLSTECSGNCPAKYTQSTSCDDKSDCVAQGKAGTFCCASLAATCSDQNPEQCIESAQCVLEENCAGPKTIILCDPAALGDCPGARTCMPSSGPMTIRKGVCAP
ncbi:MAG: hypothetical protein IPI67_30345 [Myxococcales bacterium]|nr:hypothetical protein [Myxococcales bacterium]